MRYCNRRPQIVTICVLAFVFQLVRCKVYGSIIQVRHDDDSNNAVEKPNTTLELVHLVFRHGPRTPVTTYPNDPYVNDTYEPFGWGQLTNNAKLELYKIGRWLHKRYSHILGPYYTNDVLYAQSTESPRTLMSMQTVLAGMFPPENTPMEWDPLLNWQPIPIYTEPENQDIRLRQRTPCARYDQSYDEVMQLPEVIELLDQNSDMLNELTNITGMNISSAADVTSLYITLWAQQCYGLKLPSWTEAYYPEKMKDLAAQSYLYNAYTTEMRRIKGGFFLEKMFDEMKSKAKQSMTPKGRRIFMYCAHDWSITNILAALDVWKLQLPNFSALMAFELHKDHDTGEHFVEIYFQNRPNTEPEKLTVPDCDFQCPLDRLIELAQNVLPNGASYEELCNLPTTDKTTERP